MSLTGLKMAEEAWLTCLVHALSTETEEIMGLLLGDIEYASNGSVTALVWGAAPQTRSDRRKDRVETNPEQLAAASAQAENISTHREDNTSDWMVSLASTYHCYALPCRCTDTKMYQMLDSGFVGVIFSCFGKDANKVGRIQAIAFQSIEGRRPPSWATGKELILHSGTSTNAAPSETILSTLSLEGKQVTEGAITAMGGGISQLNQQKPALEESFTNPSGMAPISANGAVMGSDSMDLSISMQEAMHRSNLDMSGVEHSRKEIPIQVVPGNVLAPLDMPLGPLVDLQGILYAEEQGAYRNAVAESMRDRKIHPLAGIHHSAAYQASLCKLLEYCLCPVLSSLWDRHQQNKAKLAALQEEAQSLELCTLPHASQGFSHSARPMSMASPRNEQYSPGADRRIVTEGQHPQVRRSLNLNAL